MKVCVQGLWHLGSVTSACLASLGHEVVGLDFDAAAIQALSRNTPPVSEPGLEDLIGHGLASGNLRFTSEIAEATKDAEVLWVAYDTPVDDNDAADAESVVVQIERVLPFLAVGATVLISSQMPVGSIRRLEATAAAKFAARRYEFACSPENLRLGNALDAFLRPDRIIMGVRPGRDRERLIRLLGPVTKRIEWMSIESAEMTKHAINAFLATSVIFANEIASICELVGADAKEVERGLKSEGRIGPKAYLSPGAAFAGGTLARDVAFLNQVSRERRLATPLLTSIKPSNDAHKQWVKHKLEAFFPDLSHTSVAVWGLTYKPGTDTLRRSMAVELCDWLIERGANVRVHDPAAKDLPRHWSGRVQRCDDPLSAVQGAHALVIATEWPLYQEVAADQMSQRSATLTVLDANHFIPGIAAAQGVRYVAVGVPAKGERAW